MVRVGFAGLLEGVLDREDEERLPAGGVPAVEHEGLSAVLGEPPNRIVLGAANALQFEAQPVLGRARSAVVAALYQIR